MIMIRSMKSHTNTKWDRQEVLWNIVTITYKCSVGRTDKCGTLIAVLYKAQLSMLKLSMKAKSMEIYVSLFCAKNNITDFGVLQHFDSFPQSFLLVFCML